MSDCKIEGMGMGVVSMGIGVLLTQETFKFKFSSIGNRSVRNSNGYMSAQTSLCRISSQFKDTKNLPTFGTILGANSVLLAIILCLFNILPHTDFIDLNNNVCFK